MKPARFFRNPIPVLCLSVVLCGCASTGDDVPNALYLAKGISSSNSYYARSQVMQTAEKELGECLFRVAGQVSLRKKVTIHYTVTSQTAPDGSPLKRSQVVLEYNQSNSIAILDHLTVLKVVRSENGTEALVRMDGSNENRTPGIKAALALDRNGNPGWVSKPPKGSGFFASVGSISQTSAIADAYANADMNAIGALATLVTKPVVSGNTSTYDATLSGVYIAHRWYNIRENRWYSLAILPR